MYLFIFFQFLFLIYFCCCYYCFIIVYVLFSRLSGNFCFSLVSCLWSVCHSWIVFLLGVSLRLFFVIYSLLCFIYLTSVLLTLLDVE